MPTSRVIWVTGVLALAWPIETDGVTVSNSFGGLGTRDTATREIAGVEVTYPDDEADVVDLLETDLKAFMGRRSREAAEETATVIGAYQKPELRRLILSRVTTLLGGTAPGPDAEAALSEGLEEFAGLMERWKAWSGSVTEIHFWNTAQLSDRFSKSGNSFQLLEFKNLHYDLRAEQKSISLVTPIMKTGVGTDWFDPKGPVFTGIRLDLPIMSPPGTGAPVIAKDLRALLDDLASHLRKMVTENLPQAANSYLVEKVLAREIETRLFKKPAPAALSLGLARAYLIPHLAQSLPGSQEDVVPGLGQFLSFPLPEGTPERKTFLRALASLDPLGEVPRGMELAAGRLVAQTLIRAGESIDNKKMPLAIFEKMNLRTPEGGYDHQGFAVALKKAYPKWDELLAFSRNQVHGQMDQAVAPPGESAESSGTKRAEKSPDYPRHYETIAFEGLTFRCPPELSDTVRAIGPEWAADLRRAREVINKRFSGPWREGVEFTDADMAALRRYGIEPDRAEAVMFSLGMGMAANADRWLAHLFRGKEAGVWFKEDLQAVIGDRGRFGGVEFNFPEKSLAINAPSFRYGKEMGPDSKVSDFGKLLDAEPPLIFPLVVKRDSVLGKSRTEQVAAIEEVDPILRVVCREAEKIDPQNFLGKPNAPVLTHPQTFFVVVHEVFEGAVVKEVVASPDRRWFCDGLANLVAIHECDRRFGEGEGMKTFESLYDPAKYRALREDVDLLAWTAAEHENSDLIGADGVTEAHYYFATLAMQEATSGKGADFIRKWIDEIRKSPWNRTNAGTVMAAYESLAGQSLAPILRRAGGAE